MVIHDLDLIRLVVGPDKADPVLIVNSNAVLTGARSGESLHAVAWRNPEILEASSGIELVKLASRYCPKILWATATSMPRVLAIEDIVRAVVFEGADHRSTVARVSCYVKDGPGGSDELHCLGPARLVQLAPKIYGRALPLGTIRKMRDNEAALRGLIPGLEETA